MIPDSPPSIGAATTSPPGVGERMNRSAVSWVTLAVFAQEAVWNFYDAQVPEQLRQHFTSAGVIGLIMGLDHSWGIFTQPSVGFLSDRLARRRTGRWPIVLIGAAVATVPFVLIPWAGNLPMLLVCVVAFAAVANAFKGVTETLVSDYVAPSGRSKAQGFVKAGVSLTIVVSSLTSLLVVDRSLRLAFAIPPLLMLIMLGLSWAFLGRRHTERLLPEEKTERVGEFGSPSAVVKDALRSPSSPTLLLMTGIFCFAGMWSALRSLMTPYGTQVLGLTRGEAGGLALPGAVAFLVCVLPIAYLSDRLGQVRAMRYGVGLFIVGVLVGFAVRTVPGTIASMVLASLGYASFAVNALVALWNLAPTQRVLGTYTALYTIASASGMALGPAVLGITIDLTSWRYMFLNAAFFAGVTFLVFTRLARRTPDLPTA
ncbi:MFS transporter [Streptomyces pseudovenezuelae]|uniref:MFS family permease n=1 Tax=Streptomyces pseudovenezuelae TaxID=67350 RepID=A0ABT6LTU7_9ACTN|nr:MFS transporter [Streptomyces pseudovenezuelae]MDH6219728.1 MFS family permease [Streptomyces pseudovenezuelae]